MAERLASRVVGRDGGALVFHDAQLYVCMQRQLRNAARKAGIVARGFGWHALRRFANTYLRKSGASSLDAQDQLGHASQYMNDLYIVAETEDYRRREQHVLRMQELLLGEVKGGVQ
jgi:integrase